MISRAIQPEFKVTLELTFEGKEEQDTFRTMISKTPINNFAKVPCPIGVDSGKQRWILMKVIDSIFDAMCAV